MRADRLLAKIRSIAALSAPLAAGAQQGPSNAPAPSYARPANPSGEEAIDGRVISFDGKYGSVGIGFGQVAYHHWH